MSVAIGWGLALTSAGLVVTLAGERGRRRWLVYVAKPSASIGFLTVALAGGALDGVYGRWVLAGLILSLGGDVLLMLSGSVWFRAGLVSFLAAHLAYIGAFLVADVSWGWVLFAGVGAVVAAWLVVRWLLPHVEGDMRVPVLAYVVVISVMVSLAVGTLGAGGTPLIATGAGLFYVSDLFVARDRFVTPGYGNRLLGLPLYYLGQVLLALSVG